jgi:hypothetical protein
MTVVQPVGAIRLTLRQKSLKDKESKDMLTFLNN